MSDPVLKKDDISSIREAISGIVTMSSRVDERVKVLLEKQSHQDEIIHEMRNIMASLVGRVGILESKDDTEFRRMVTKNNDRLHEIELAVQSLKVKESQHENKWNHLIDFAGRVLWLILGAYLLYKLEIPAPIIN